MSETVNIVTGEVVPDTGLVTKKLDISDMIKAADLPLLEVMKDMKSLDWRALTPPQMAVLLMQKPFTSGGGTMYLSFKQAILFATRCYELGVSPFSSEVWFDPNRASVNLTLEGKRQVARNKNIDLGPPSFEEKTRSWDSLPKLNTTAEELKKLGYKADIGVTCKIRVGDPKFQECVNYTAWMSEWFVTKSPVWQAKPVHMLQTRACEKAISMALGTGASDMLIDD